MTDTPHNPDAHHRDRLAAGWPTCPRCLEVAIEFHDRHRLAVPDDIRRRDTPREVANLADYREAL